MLATAVVFDLDGVLFDPTLRKEQFASDYRVDPHLAHEHKEIGKYYHLDTPINDVVAKVNEWKDKGHEIYYLTARRSFGRKETWDSLQQHGFPTDRISQLYMKPSIELDTQEFKKAVLADLQHRYTILGFWDDWEPNRVVATELGIPAHEVVS